MSEKNRQSMLKQKCARKWDTQKDKLKKAKSWQVTSATRRGQCVECLGTIETGEEHYHFVHEDEFCTDLHVRLCFRCDQIRRDLCPASPIGMLDQDLRECYGVGIDGGDGIGAYMGDIALPWDSRGQGDD